MGLFFVSCPLNFENELAKELKSFWFEMIDLDGLPTRSVFPELQLIRGGIELETQDHLGFQINFFSKLASRVLLRISKFEARYYDQFEKAFAKVEFEKYFSEPQFKIKIESHKSRLNNDKNITEAATKSISKKFQIKEESGNSVFIRIEKDRVTVSLDTSGEHLHRRGYATFRGEAPLRETLAAYMVRKLQTYAEINKDLSLIDPFVGSGTLLFETASRQLPNFSRHYSWLDFKNAPKLFKSESWKKNYRWFEQRDVPNCIGYDIDAKAISNLQKNTELYTQVFESQIDISAHTEDSSKLALDRNNLRKSVWVVTNPPYGIRLADENAKKIIEGLDGSIDGLIVLHPVPWKFHFKKLKLSEIEDFSNQGLNLKLSIYQKTQAN